jgi:hypothetical protein
MELKEKEEFLSVIKGKIEETAKATAEGKFKEVEKLNQDLEERITKALADNHITKAEFDKQEEKFRQEVEALKSKNKKEITFNMAFEDAHNANIEAMKALANGKGGAVTFDVTKTPGIFTSANSLGGTTAAAQFGINNNELIVPIARRRNHVRNIIGMGSTDTTPFPYLKETPKEGSVGTQNPEGAAKAQVEYKATLEYANEETIAAFQRMGRQTLTNVRGLSSFLNMVMLKDLLIKEDAQLLNGTGLNGQVLGFTVGASDATDIPASFLKKTPTIYDAIAAAAATLASSDYLANFAMVNPIQFWDMVTLKDEDGRYQNNVIFDSAASVLYVFGIPVIASTAIAAGTFVVGDSTYVMPMQREGISLRFSEEDSDNFQKNLVTARVEERIIQAVLRSDAFFKDTIANVEAAIFTT